ncbi:MAG: hypothetical protein U0Q08_07075 [Dermatophilaceae bacterium]|jgi:hypothetical protein
MTSSSREDQLAMEPMDALDEELLARIHHLHLTRDPVPDGLVDRISFAMTVAALEADVAQTVAEGGLTAAGARSTSYDRATRVTFAHGDFSAMVTIDIGRDGSGDVHGWITEPGIDVELRERSRAQTVPADGDGRFHFSGVERGLVHLVFHRHGGHRPIITPTLEI